MLLAMTDARVVIIKLADRLHNMRTLEVLPHAKQMRIARETLDVYAPLANRLGMWDLKSDLEDYSFRYLHPQEHSHLTAVVAEMRDRSEIDACMAMCKYALTEQGIDASYMEGRPKGLYSIYKKMQAKSLAFDEVHDVRAVRVIVKSEEECYRVLKAVNSHWTPVEGRLKDYIAKPKANAYQSLHTVVKDARGRPVEVQIRTEHMHHVAEYGVAAHWRYKEPGENKYVEQQVAWAREMLSWQTNLRDRHKVKAVLGDAPEAGPRSCCTFPEHLPHCPVINHDARRPMAECCSRHAAARPVEEDSPVHVVTLGGEHSHFSVVELPPKATIRQLLAHTHRGATDADLLATGLRILVNQEPIDDDGRTELDIDMDARLRMGDRVEVVYDPVPSMLDLSPAAVERTRKQLSRMLPPTEEELAMGADLRRSMSEKELELDVQAGNVRTRFAASDSLRSPSQGAKLTSRGWP